MRHTWPLPLWRARKTDGLWLLGPFVAAFLISNLVDWPWHLAGLTAAWAAAAGGLAGCAIAAAGDGGGAGPA